MKSPDTIEEKILLVDDETVIRKVIHQRLKKEGFECREAEDGDEALEIVKKEPPSLVILDIKMPGKPGNEVLPEIKAISPDTAVIMATAISDTQVAIDCMREGAYDYFTKPFNLDEVTLGVLRVLKNRRLTLENRDYQHHLEQKVKEQADKIRKSFINAITSLAYALEVKDRYTSGHSTRVAVISEAIARELGLGSDVMERIKLAGLVHDIGKIGIRENILGKPAKLTKEEFEQVKKHPQVGEHILKPVMEDGMILEAVRHHHERYDGRGYPDGLGGKQIPLWARIMAVADSYDAITSERPYRQAMPVETALAEIKSNCGSQFDPEVVDAFFTIEDKILSIKEKCKDKQESQLMRMVVGIQHANR